MPETRSNTIDAALSAITTSVGELSSRTQRVEEVIENHTSQMERLFTMMEEMREAIQELKVDRGPRSDKQPINPDSDSSQLLPTPIQYVQSATQTPQPNSRNHVVAETSQTRYGVHQQLTQKLPRLDIPYFSGEGVEGWLFQIERYFEVHGTPTEQKLMVATFYMSGEALKWYQWMHATGQIKSWEMLACDLCLRFGPSMFWNAEVTLNKLQQTTNVSAYITEFEALSIRTPGLTADNLLHRFLAGLKEDIHRELVLLDPKTLQNAWEWQE